MTTDLLLKRINDPKMRRRHVASAYRIAIVSRHIKTDWKKVNSAIIERWSLSALIWIKNLAWSKKVIGE